MNSFKDTAGRTWTIDVNLPTRKRVKAEAGLDLFAIFEPEQLDQLAGEPDTLVAALYSLCGEQVAKLGLTPEQFAAAFDGDTLDAAAEALMEAIADFFPRRRQTMRTLLAKGRIAAETAMQRALARVESIQPDDLLPTTLREPVTSWPESSGSTPAA